MRAGPVVQAPLPAPVPAPTAPSVPARIAALLLAAILIMAAGAEAVSAQGRGGRPAGEPGEFDYYVMSLTWSPGWCAREGETEGQCAPQRRHGFLLHGLWPQYDRGGWPEFCRTPVRDPTRVETASMTDIMGSAGLAWYQWKKHGRCAGLSAADYLSAQRAAYRSITMPKVFQRLDRDVRLPASVVEEAFIEVNPRMTRDMLTVTCSAGHIAEVRVCLTKGLEPRRCGPDVIRDCTLKNAIMEAP